MISKQKIKLIHSLEQKKHREEEKLFLAEGPKVVGELAGRFECVYVAGTEDWMEANEAMVGQCTQSDVVTAEELSRASLLKSPQKVLALFAMKDLANPSPTIGEHELCLALDSVQDPGNMGTIIRLANWFGIRHILCSTSTADAYSPKVVQATMGALSKVDVHYLDLVSWLGNVSEGTPVYGTFLGGEDIYEAELSDNGIVVMGNEGNGISTAVGGRVSRRLYIPPYPAGSDTVESLNVGVATAITCAEVRGRATINSTKHPGI